ncbi:MAG: phytanoyl-CoA dioxygenase family protein [Burkholderiales bacterium]
MSALVKASAPPFSAAEVGLFAREGFVISKGIAPARLCERMAAVAQDHLARQVQPIEYEADVRYPGAPLSRQAEGGRTVRRLLQGCERDPIFRKWATSPLLALRLAQLLAAEPMLSQAHHNCVMTKHPRFSSRTGWHQDIRYWSFERPELVSVWLALRPEYHDNGCLWVVPSSHAMSLDRARFDQALFFREDVEDNRAVLERRAPVELGPGDVLFFHCRLLHAAGWNRSAETKFSAVFTYHAQENSPLANTRSASGPSIELR